MRKGRPNAPITLWNLSAIPVAGAALASESSNRESRSVRYHSIAAVAFRAIQRLVRAFENSCRIVVRA